MAQEEVDLGCYSASWQEATTKFQSAAVAAGARLVSPVLKDVEGNALCDEDGTELTMDFAVWSTCEVETEPATVLLYTVGIHGVEGYTGSAILLQILQKRKMLADLPPNVKIIFAHVLNPYGMAHLRRFNERNVDLNRNWLEPEEFARRAKDTSPIYKQYYDFVNPTTVSACDVPEFYAHIALMLAFYGYNDLKQAFGGGQSEFPEGLLFGGSERESGTQLLIDTLTSEGVSRSNQALQRVMHVDIHTGLGPWKHDSILTEQSFLEDMKRLLGPEPAKGDWHYDLIGSTLPPLEELDEAEGDARRKEAGDVKDGTAYEASGNVNKGLIHSLRGRGVKWLTFAQEFGTLSGLEIVRIMRKENAHHHHRGLTKESDERKAVKEAFCPSNNAWRSFTLQRGLVVFDKVINTFRT